MTAATAVSPYLERQSLAALEHMRFTTRHRIEGSFSGRHQSRQQGGAGEFVDFREYAPGEDLRRLDWKVFGRTGKAYVRLFQDETNLLCTLAVDASGSMMFGAHRRARQLGSKLEYVKYLATAFSHVISGGQDQVGLAVLTESLKTFIPCGGTPSHVSRVQGEIARITTRPVKIMAPALTSLFERLPRRGVLMLFSDFLSEDLQEVFAVLRLFRHHQWQVVVLHLIDPDEERLPEGSAFRFEGMENDGRLSCSPPEIREAYQQRFDAHVRAVRTLALAEGCDYRRVSTAIPYLQTVGEFLIEANG